MAPITFAAPALDIKLTGQNYREWAFSFKMLLHSAGAGLVSHLTDSPPDASDKDAKAWRDVDDRVMAILAMNVDPTIRYCLEDLSTAKEMWDFLKERYQQSSYALRYSTLKQLHHLQQQDLSIEDYLAAFMKLSSQLVSMVPKPNSACKECGVRDKYEQQNKIFHFMMGLRSTFEPIRAQIFGRSSLPTMAEALSAVLAEETRLHTIDDAPLVPQHSVLVAPPQYVVMDSSLVSKEKPKEKPKCKHCGGKTHTEERCFQKYPHLLKEFKAKRAASHKGTTTTVSPATPSPLPPSTTTAASQFTPVGAYMSGGSIASALVSGSSNPSSSWYWPSP
ncbi:unnamed protein product [Miscanthus lutarioriparius]|uniref:Retrotransposon Copia-like N-terminal domain-containing protein n=1 Tax=Miscanthus lutarioriparius TaxID=422564 RepID=A0A811NAB5_9POAL|nr:unnamed protein product [Miscanthus lutarioriparius]